MGVCEDCYFNVDHKLTEKCYPKPESKPQESVKKRLLNAIKDLDGACVVNLDEPSEGDLERVYEAYLVLRKREKKPASD